MRFGQVPQIAVEARPWAPVREILPPPGEEHRIRSLECQIDEATEFGRTFRFFVELEPGDLEKIQAGHPIAKRVFVNSLADLFHDDVPDVFIARVFAVMALAPQHTFQVLTKRHARMRSLLNSPSFSVLLWAELADRLPEFDIGWPLPNVWLGVSVENQQWADIRIPALLETPAAVRFLSCEPLLGPITLTRLHAHCPTHDFVGGFCTGPCPDLVTPDWVIVGGESGPNARPMHPEWARGLRDQCVSLRIPFFFKQCGEWVPAPWHGVNGATHAFTGGFYKIDGQHTENFMQLGHSPTSTERDDETPAGAQGMRRVGKKAAGRELDGRTWDEYPAGQR